MMDIGKDPTDNDIIGGIPLRQIKFDYYNDPPKTDPGCLRFDEFIESYRQHNWHTEGDYAFNISD